MSSAGSRPASSRLFFSLWPDPALQTQLQAWQKCVVSGQLVPLDRLHLTLAFLGDVENEVIGPLVESAAALKLARFELVIDHTGYFRRPQITWAGPSKVPAELIQLHQDLAQTVHTCGIDLPNESFRPHVTLARKSPPPALGERAPAIHWSVETFHLVESQLSSNGPEYRTLHSFTLY